MALSPQQQQPRDQALQPHHHPRFSAGQSPKGDVCDQEHGQLLGATCSVVVYMEVLVQRPSQAALRLNLRGAEPNAFAPRIKSGLQQIT